MHLSCVAAGQERFRTLTSSYYRNVQGIMLGMQLFVIFFGIFIRVFGFDLLMFVCRVRVYERISVYDVTRRETFSNLSDVWGKEVELYCTNQDCVKMLIGNKVDIVSNLYDASSVNRINSL